MNENMLTRLFECDIIIIEIHENIVAKNEFVL